MLHCWGDGACGQLGLGEEAASAPVPFRPGPGAPLGRGVRLVACGARHTLLLFTDGSVASCGDNSQGQLGRRLPPGLQRSYEPEQVQALARQTIVHVSCGKEHSVAICSNGSVFSWGAGTLGQLGTGERQDRVIPKAIDGLSRVKIIQVACGHYHSIALTKDGRVYSWGQNIHGQLGLGKGDPFKVQPQHIPALDGIPLAQVAAGGAHSFALSLSGVAYGWGRNNAHQLGLSRIDPKEQVFKPCSVASLRNLDVIYISCGDEHTAVLTQDGSVFTFGDDSAGQLGHCFSAEKTGPQKIDCIEGQVSLLACGSYHTLVYISASGQLISFGRGPLQHTESGASHSKQDETPSFNISALISPNELQGIQVKQIFAGPYVNFASTLKKPVSTRGNRTTPSIETLPKISQVDRVLIEKWMWTTAESEMRRTSKREIETIFSSPSCLTASFLKPRSVLETGCCIMVDLQKAGDVLAELTKTDWIAGRISFSLLNHLIPALPLDSPHQEALSSFLLLPECSVALEAQNQKSLAIPFAKAVGNMKKRSLDILDKYWSQLPASLLERVVQMLKKAVKSLLHCYFLYPDCQELIPVLELLKRLYKVNKKTNYKLQISDFYIEEVSKRVTIEDLRRWYLFIEKPTPPPKDQYPVSFCCFPFVFDPISKMVIFSWDSALRQLNARHVILENWQRNRAALEAPTFLLRVQRRNLVENTLRRLSCMDDAALKKELRVEFEGEMAGYDAGGVLLEFFLCMFEEMTQPDFGMFMHCEPNSPMWFPPVPSVEKNKYFLFGILYGLSLFNRVTVYVPFPLAFFKKLIGRRPSLEDLKELSPVLGKSLQEVLDYEDDDIEENLQLYYSISWDNMDIDLIPNGKSVAVTNTNKKDFVNKYVDYIFNKSVEGIFEEFKRGFYKVLEKRIVGFFEPQELMAVAIGNENYDWDAFEKNTVYWGMYSSEHPTIKLFWEVFHELPLHSKRGFLLFVRGTDRVPIQGSDFMKMTVHSYASLSKEHIPEAQTCFGVLLLPPYSTKQKLKEKLLQAIEHNQGFGKQ